MRHLKNVKSYKSKFKVKSNLSFLHVQMQNTPNIQYVLTETSKDFGPPVSKALISPSSIREDAKQKPVRKKRLRQENFANTKS